MKQNNLVSQLYLKMTELYHGDAKRIQHFTKVHSYARLIGMQEGLSGQEQFILEAAALTHDVGIHLCEEKYGSCGGKCQEQEGPAIAEAMMRELGFEEAVISRVCYLIGHHHTYTDMDGMDYRILVEADFLVNLYEDAIGMDGIRAAYRNIFRTETGKRICREMYGTEEGDATGTGYVDHI